MRQTRGAPRGRRRRLVRAVVCVVLGVLTTLVTAWVLPHVYEPALMPGWNRPLTWRSQPELPSYGGPPSMECREGRLVEKYVYTDPEARKARDSGVSSSGTWNVPAWARVPESGSTWYRVQTSGTGWPMRAMASEAWVASRGAMSEYRWNCHVADSINGPILIPMRPLWQGLAMNTAIYGVTWWCVLWIPLLQRRWWREGRRLRRGLCPACGYDLCWDLAKGCSECGWRKGNGELPRMAGMGADGRVAADVRVATEGTERHRQEI